MRANIAFVATLWLALFMAWTISGEQFLDLMFAMPDLGPVDDLVLSGVVWMEDWRADLGLPDLFGRLRATLHRISGLG